MGEESFRPLKRRLSCEGGTHILSKRIASPRDVVGQMSQMGGRRYCN